MVNGLGSPDSGGTLNPKPSRSGSAVLGRWPGPSRPTMVEATPTGCAPKLVAWACWLDFGFQVLILSLQVPLIKPSDANQNLVLQ